MPTAENKRKKILKADKGKIPNTYRGTKIRSVADFFLESLQVQFSSVQSLSRIRLLAASWTAAHQASLAKVHKLGEKSVTSLNCWKKINIKPKFYTQWNYLSKIKESNISKIVVQNPKPSLPYRNASNSTQIQLPLWLIHVDVWQKTTKFCKAIILQFKNK